jgi:hypothetical protein
VKDRKCGKILGARKKGTLSVVFVIIYFKGISIEERPQAFL